MTQMKVASLTTLRMAMVQDKAKDAVVMAAVMVAVVVVAVVAVVVAQIEMEAVLPPVTQALLKAGPTHRPMVTWMTMLNSCMIT